MHNIIHFSIKIFSVIAFLLLLFVNQSQAGWFATPIDFSGNVGFYSSMVLDSNDKAYIVYYDFANNSLKYATDVSGQWVKQTITNPAGHYISLAIDSGNNLHVSFYDPINGDLKYANKPAGGSWAVTTIDSNGNVGLYSSIVTDSNSNIHVSYYDLTNGDLKYVTKTPSGSWSSPLTIDSAGVVGFANSIAVGPSNRVHICYLDISNGSNIILKYVNSTNWTNYQTVVSGQYVGRYGCSIAVDNSNYAHVSYHDNGNIKYATNLSGSWQNELVESYSYYYSSITLDSNNKAHVSYCSSTDGLKYATNASGSWVKQIVDTPKFYYFNSSIALDSHDKAHISYYFISDGRAYGDGLKYATGPMPDDIGLRAYDGTANIIIAGESPETLASPLRIRKGTSNYGIVMVNTADPEASKLRINTPSGVKALKKIGNLPPYIVSPGDKNVTEGNQVQFTVTANDSNGVSQITTIYVDDLPAGATFTYNGNGTGTFTWNTPANAAGYYLPHFIAKDSGGLESVHMPVKIKVWDADRKIELYDAGNTLVYTFNNTSIQSAINDSRTQNGYTLLVYPAIYFGNVDFRGKSIKLKSTNPQDPNVVASTVIDSRDGPDAMVVYLGTGESSNSEISGFTIQKGWAYGILCTDTSPQITYNKIIGNGTFCSSGNCWGGGIEVDAGAQPVLIQNNTIMGNISDHGGGIGISWGSAAVIRGNTIKRNFARFGAGINSEITTTMENNIITENYAFYGGGIGDGSYGGNPWTINNNLIHKNIGQFSGGGIYSYTYYVTPITLANNTIADNGAGYQGGGFISYGSNPNPQITMYNIIAWGNTSPLNSQLYRQTGSMNVTYSDIEGGLSGSGNKNVNPQFANPASGDYHLGICTAGGNNCVIDAADANNDPATDIEGHSRYQNTSVNDTGTGPPPPVDMGAYERQVSP